jgi:uncharacterized protein YndB with AHSA1/START domain
MPIAHDTFVITREFPTTPEKLFQAHADPKIRAKWFRGPDSWVETERSLDLRPGGTELLTGKFEDGTTTLYRAHFYDVVPNQRIVNSFEVVLSGECYSVSLTTAEFEPSEKGTKMVFTEQIVYLDCSNASEVTPGRIKGTDTHYSRLLALLESE